VRGALLEHALNIGFAVAATRRRAGIPLKILLFVVIFGWRTDNPDGDALVKTLAGGSKVDARFWGVLVS